MPDRVSGFIPKAFIDDLLTRADLVELINRFVPLKKQGSGFVARCPFHDEKTPSFHVSPTKQLFHCFGCGASGNAISFLMAYQHLEFVEAVEDLAGAAGLPVPKVSGAAPPVEAQAPLYDLMSRVADCYRSCLQSGEGVDALEYLQRRGVARDVAESFHLGFALNRWQMLLNRFDRSLLVKAGLIVERDDGKAYDRFRNRLIFPIRDKRGRFIAFGGRVLDDALPKYLNSPETSIFSKSREVYGLYEALNGKTRPECLVVVEGYLDVLALAGAGLSNVVATLGTAVTPFHLQQLFRHCAELVFCFDGDSAGRKAAWRALETVLPLLQEGRRARFLLLPEGLDPDDLIKKEGGEAFTRRIAEALPLSDFFFQRLTGSGEVAASMEMRAQWGETGRKLLAQLPSGVFRDLMFQQLADKCGTARPKIAKAATIKHAGSRKAGQKTSPARLVIGLLLQRPELAEKVQGHDDWRQWQFPGDRLFHKVMSTIIEQTGYAPARIMERFRDSEDWPSIQRLLAMVLAVPDEGLDQEFSDALGRLAESSRKQQIEYLLTEAKCRSLNDDERQRLKHLLATSQA